MAKAFIVRLGASSNYKLLFFRQIIERNLRSEATWINLKKW